MYHATYSLLYFRGHYFFFVLQYKQGKKKKQGNMDLESSYVYRDHSPCTDMKSSGSRIFRHNSQNIGQRSRINDDHVTCKFNRGSEKPYYCKDPNRKGRFSVVRLAVLNAQKQSFRSFERALDDGQTRQNQRNQASCQRLSESLKKK